jgi:hypothetical protein
MVSELYVGHTTNFVQRKHAHKQSCINEKSPNHKCKLYEVIRNNGGWINWKMEIIHFFNCKNHYEARKKEQEYFLSLNATLNSIEPYAIPKPKEIVTKNKIIKEVLHCNECNKYFNNTNLLETHNKTNKHMKRLDMPMETKLPNTSQKYNCEKCGIKTNNKKDYNNHLLTRKHLSTTIHTIKHQTSQSHVCMVCNKIYDSRSGLWRHQKKCKELVNNNNNYVINDENSIIRELDMKTLIMEVVKSNMELQKQTMKMHQQMIEVCKNSNTTINNNNSYGNNKTI